MARTTILPTDPNKRKAWQASVANDAAKDQYFSRLEGPEGSRSAVIRKTDLEAGAGDEVTQAMVAKFRGKPIHEGEKLAGKEFKLQTASHTMRVNEFRHGVNVGARIEQSRVGYNIKSQARQKLTEYIKEVYEEITCMAASGARGVSDEIQHYDTSYTGYPNALRAPDTGHQFIGPLGTRVKNTLVTGDKMTLATINKLSVKAKKMLGGSKTSPSKMVKVRKGGKDVWILSVCPEVMQDIRDDSGAQGWFEAQKALVSTVGRDAEMFKGGAGYFNGVLVDEMEVAVKFSDYGAGSDVPAARSLFMGANAVAVANGVKGMPDGMTVALDEDMDDRKHDSILFFELIFGADKPQFNSMDYGMISVDTAYTAAV